MASRLLCNLEPQKSMGPDETHPRVLRELVEELTKPLSIIYQQSRPTMEVPGDWKLVNVTPIIRRVGRRSRKLQACQPDLIVREGHGVIIWSAIRYCVQDNQGFRPGQPHFMQGRSCLTNLIIFYDEVTCLVDMGEALDVVCLDFSRAFCDIPPLR